MNEISEFVKKHRKKAEVSVKERVGSLPWYKRPISSANFKIRKATDGKYYARHNEWSEKTWIGPYDTIKETDGVISSYVRMSQISPLDRMTEKYAIRSVHIDDIDSFFL